MTKKMPRMSHDMRGVFVLPQLQLYSMAMTSAIYSGVSQKPSFSQSLVITFRSLRKNAR